MPAAQLVSAILEKSINQLLSLDESSNSRMKPLQGKRMLLVLQELPFALTFQVEDELMVGTAEKDISPKEYDVAISCSVWVMQELQDASQLSRMIKQDRLILHGDLNRAQQFSQLFLALDIDWEEILSKYVGDVVAHQAGQFFKRAQQKLMQLDKNMQQLIKDGAMEEKQIAATPQAMEKFVDDVHDVQAKVGRLEQRLAKLI